MNLRRSRSHVCRAPSRRAPTAAGRGRSAPARVALLVTTVAAVAAIAWSWSLGGALGRPPWQPVLWVPWWEAHDPLDAVAAIASIVAVVALGWLVVVAAVHLGATACGFGGLRRRTARLLPPVLRTLVATAAVGAVSLPAAVAGAAPAPPLDDVPPTMVRLDPPAPSGPAAPQPPGGDDPVAPPALRVTVVPGDHLWGIAAARLHLALGVEADAEQIRPYWAALVEANRERLVDPDDPDLLVPGQELVLPG